MRKRTAIMAGLMLNLGLGSVVFAQPIYRGSVYGQSAAAGNPRQAERMVRQAYREILGREPDPSGMQEYTQQLLYGGWSYADLRRTLLDSDEYAQRNGGVARTGWRGRAYGNGYGYGNGGSQAAAIVRDAYRSVLGREPDAVGMRDYTTRILRDGWTERDVVNSLRSSPEYRSRFGR